MESFTVNSPDTVEIALMQKHDITFDGKQYIYHEYRYDRLKDAISYATMQERKISGTFGPFPSLICPECGCAGEGVQLTKGSFGVELILWLFAIVPGLIYSIWRLNTRYCGCLTCKSNMLPTSSPRGKKLIEQYQPELLKAYYK